MLSAGRYLLNVGGAPKTFTCSACVHRLAWANRSQARKCAVRGTLIKAMLRRGKTKGFERPATGRRASYRSGFAFGTLSFFVVALLGVLSTIVTARVYGVRVIGQYALVWAPVAALWMLSSAKEQQALIKQITTLAPRDPRVTQLFAAVFTFSWLLTLVVAALDAVACCVVFRGPLHAPALLPPALVTIAGYVVIINTGWNLDSVLSAFVAGRQIFWVRLHEVLSFMIIATAVGLVWRSVWGLVIAILGASTTALVHRVLVTRPFVRGSLTLAEFRGGMEALPDLLRFGIRATPGEIAQGISQQAGIWALGMLAPVAIVGAYSRAYNIPWRLTQASNRISEILYPTLVGRHTSGDGEGFDRALVDSVRYEAFGMLMIAAAIGGAARSVLSVFGTGFAQAVTALALLALFPAFASTTLTQTQALWATDRPGRTSLIALARMLSTLALLVVLTPSLGITGPAIALLAGYVVALILSGYALRSSLSRPLRYTWPVRERLAMLSAYAAGFLAAHGVERAAPTIAALPLGLLAGALSYVFVFIACGGVNTRDRTRLRQGRAWLQARRPRARRHPGEAPVCVE
jgi:O-antigen/teichoic acid export membrane protein